MRCANSALGRVLLRIVDFFVYAILGASLFCSLLYSFQMARHERYMFAPKEYIWLIPGLLSLYAVAQLARRLAQARERTLVLCMVAVEACMAAAVIASYPTLPVTDYEKIWQAAREMAAGTFTSGLDPSAYMYYYNWNLGIAAFESLFVRLGANFFALKVINAGLLILLQYMEYRLVSRRFGRTAGVYAYVLAVFYIPWVLTAPQFTNHHIGIVLLLAVFRLIEQQRPAAWLCAGALLACTNVLRPIGIIGVLSVLCLAVWQLANGGRGAADGSATPVGGQRAALRGAYRWLQNPRLRVLISLAAFLVAYYGARAGFDALFMALRYTDGPISAARVPYFKFQKGAYGYPNPYEDLKSFGFDYDKYNAAMKAQLLDMLHNHTREVADYVVHKVIRFLGKFDVQYVFTYNYEQDVIYRYPLRAVYSTGYFQYMGVLALSLLGYRTWRARRQADVYQIFFIGNTLVYIFIEANAAYRFENYTVLLMLAALGMERLKERPLHCGGKRLSAGKPRKGSGQ